MLSACGKPTEKLIPFLVPPDDGSVPGVANYYASSCRQCPAGCGILAKVAEGRAKKIEGNPLHPVSRGKLCARGQAALQELYHPDRIRQPMKRTGEKGSGEFEPVSWDEGLKILLDELKQLRAQGEADKLLMITPRLGGTLGELVENFMTAYGASRLFSYEFASTECFEKANLAVYGRSDLPDFDIENTRYLMSFGADLFETYLSPVRYADGFGKMRQARRTIRGAFIYAGPRMSMTAASADNWFPVKTGQEGTLALAMARVILEEGLYDRQAVQRIGGDPRQWLRELGDYRLDKAAEATGIPGSEIAATAREFGRIRPSIAVAGDSVAHQTNGLEAFKAIHFLNLLVGNLDRSGGILFPPAQPGSFPSPTYSALRTTVDEMAGGNFKVAMVYRTNPVHSLPSATGFQEAFEKIPLIVSFSSFMDDTARRADLILPDHTDLESWGDVVPFAGIRSQVTGILQPVVMPLYDTRAFPDLVLAAARGLGGSVSDALEDESYLDRLQRAVQQRLGVPAGPGFQQAWTKVLQRGGIFEAKEGDGSGPVRRRVSNPGKVRPPRFDGDRKEYPYHLSVYSSPAFYDGRNAHLPWLQEMPDPMTTAVWGSWVEIHPETAAVHGIQHGDLVEIESTVGSLRLPAVIYPAIRPNLVAIPMGQGHEGMGRYAESRGANPLSLLSGMMDEENQLPAWGATRVRIRRISEKGELVVMGHPEGSYHGELLEI
jgi:anaerobic selenocysteine-containing dehydrogenase